MDSRKADTDGGVVVTSPVVAVLESLVTAWPAVLDVEVVVPAAPELVIISQVGHPDTEALPLPAELLVLKAGGGLVLLQPVVTLVAVLGRGGRHWHRGGEVGVVLTVVQPVVAVVVVVAHTGCGVLVASALYAVLTDDTAVLAVQAVLPLWVPAGFHLQGFQGVVGVEREAESHVYRTVFLGEVSNVDIGVMDQSFIALQCQTLSREASMLV